MHVMFPHHGGRLLFSYSLYLSPSSIADARGTGGSTLEVALTTTTGTRATWSRLVRRAAWNTDLPCDPSMTTRDQSTRSFRERYHWSASLRIVGRYRRRKTSLLILAVPVPEFHCWCSRHTGQYVGSSPYHDDGDKGDLVALGSACGMDH